ncbi:hypothetical protein SAMN05444747_1111 [Variovorax sp. OV329]|nr:hypothetical protein SAMN05444747_1111 [Variovorax sp. OV329]
MKLLRISENCGHFLTAKGEFSPIDKISKEDLLRLVDHIFGESEVEFDPYDDQLIKNQAHQVIYKSVVQKLSDLSKRKQEFVDESARVFLEEYERYRE